MNTSTDAQLFEDTFHIENIDSSKYDRVSRLAGRSTTGSEVSMTLDINSQIYPVAVNDTLRVVLASTLSLDGTKDDSKGWRDVGAGEGETTLADLFDYVCHGKIYKFEEGNDGMNIKVYISFGGLLMAIDGPYKKLTPLRVDYTYLLIKK
ncbi:UDP-glucose 4-epimerase Gal10 [Halenospora varia]|nr:UDP-glucose 4-epimerase Gal10 [Halenospora varia]